jgi:hypothetical protein
MRSAASCGRARRSRGRGDAAAWSAWGRWSPRPNTIPTHDVPARRRTRVRGRSACGHGTLLRLQERPPRIVQELGGRDRRRSVVQLRDPHRARGVDDRLVLAAPDALARATGERGLGAAGAQTFAHTFAGRGLVRLRCFHGAPCASVSTNPSGATVASRAVSRFRMVSRSCRNQMPRTPAGESVHACVRHSWAPRGWGHCQRHHGSFPLRYAPILEQRFLPGDLVPRRLPAGLIEFLAAIEAVAALAPQLTGFGDMAEWLRQCQHADLHLDDLLFPRPRPHSCRQGEDSTGRSDQVLALTVNGTWYSQRSSLIF